MRLTAPAVAPALCALAALLTGCASTSSSDTSRTGMEQLLISDAVDKSLSKIDFRPLAGRQVFVDAQYLDCCDEGYVVGGVRHRVVAAGGRLAKDADSSDCVCEIRSGGVGTDRQETYVGMDGISFPSMNVELPTVKLWNKERQMATAKIGVMVYDTKTRVPLGPGGMTLARSDDSNAFLMGVGPWQGGSVKQSIKTGMHSGRAVNPINYQVAVADPAQVPGSGVRLAAAGDEPGAAAPAAARSSEPTPPADAVDPPAAPPAEVDPFDIAAPLFP